MNIADYYNKQKKFVTRHRDDMYHEIKKHDETGMFNSMVGLFLIAFAVGYHKNVTAEAHGNGAINHTNAVYIKDDDQELIIRLMLDRHPDLQDGNELWDLVEMYAEGGISILYESLRKSNWVLNVELLNETE